MTGNPAALDVVGRAALWVGRPLTGGQRDRLERFGGWLESEAIPAGGLAAGEASRIPDRHLADSLTFAIGWPKADPPVLVDLGAGVGLPGIPLAILMPDTRVLLVDRSTRRTRLARRAGRILSLRNLHVMEEDVERLGMQVPAIVSRATMPTEELRGHVRRLLRVDGRAVVGGSWVSQPKADGDEIVPIPSWVLDRAAWLRIITPQ